MEDSLESNGATTLSELLNGPSSLSEIRCYDPTEPTKPCPICGGLGVVKASVAVDDPRFGKLYRCPNYPAEVDQERRERLRRLSNLDALAEQTFENFEWDIRGYSPKEIQSLQLAFNAARSYADDLQGWLLLEGSYGTGKTHLAAAVGNARLDKGDSVLFITTPDLLDHLRSTYAPSSDIAYDELFERLRNTHLLILDDLGTENPSEWAKEKLFQLLNHRYTHRRATVITTNAELDSLDGRVRSRLMDNTVIHRVVLDAPDYRSHQPNSQAQLKSRLPMYAHMQFENFDVETRATPEERQRLTQAARAAYQFAQNPENWILFAGEFGSGKTHLAAAIANERRNQGDEVLFLTVPDLLDYLRTTFAPDSTVTFDRLFERVRNVSLLVLDDLGTESARPWTQEKLFQLLDYRYVGRLPTIITTSAEMNSINPRIVSRLIDPRICRIVEINVHSYAHRLKR